MPRPILRDGVVLSRRRIVLSALNIFYRTTRVIKWATSANINIMNKKALLVLGILLVVTVLGMTAWQLTYQKPNASQIPSQENQDAINQFPQLSSKSADGSYRAYATIDKEILATTSPNPVINGTADYLSFVSVGISNLSRDCALGDYFYKDGVPVVNGRWSIKVEWPKGGVLPPCDTYQLYVQIVTDQKPSSSKVIILDEQTLMVKKGE